MNRTSANGTVVKSMSLRRSTFNRTELLYSHVIKLFFTQLFVSSLFFTVLLTSNYERYMNIITVSWKVLFPYTSSLLSFTAKVLAATITLLSSTYTMGDNLISRMATWDSAHLNRTGCIHLQSISLIKLSTLLDDSALSVNILGTHFQE